MERKKLQDETKEVDRGLKMGRNKKVRPFARRSVITYGSFEKENGLSCMFPSPQLEADTTIRS